MSQGPSDWQSEIVDNESVWKRTHDIHPTLNPLFDESVRRILGRARLGTAPRVLDVGCGLGSWIFTLLDFCPDATCVGVDMEASFIERARIEAKQRGLEQRTDFRVGDATRDVPDEKFDVILCTGLSEAFGGLAEMLEFLRPYLHPTGTMIIGQGLWEKEPSEECLRVLDVERDEHTTFEGTVETIVGSGWAPIYGHKSTEQEWDDFIWACVDGLTRWALDEANEPSQDQSPMVSTPSILLATNSYRRAWLDSYRNTLGYATFVLRPVPRQWLPLMAATERAHKLWSTSANSSPTGT